MKIHKLPIINPGEILAEEFLRPLKLTQYRLAKDLGVPARRINEIVHGTRAISIDTALRLAKFFGTTPQFWMNLQMQYDLSHGIKTVGTIIEKNVSPFTYLPKTLSNK
ncbi:MAG: addiction module antidote protein, HigA family [Candidatus Vogelbacteria bacterium CG10_big_fil_rev_8_21_14_0_10_45_14]|uniref:Addiction module antidote protein, HigA family n=1 Tax=Candidatus Vogelbacteria bacterium CG10_big_fil_rev_8_21_14_0_10_45_14 TaxID=1975042 RepID=A0A2H0RL87_9BACT|nr:MAG: addiction module antidote protein, HigA family [Candidatus Vogelbacteria bacterium CG10_big_fil_rev_8_21_14_0_10_45_14]